MLFAFFIQTIVTNKFVGHGIVIGLFVSLPILFRYGFENTLYLPGQIPTYTYTDMNGYGHFVAALTWAIVYWFAIMAVLAVFSIALSRRGAEDSWSARTKVAAQRLPRLVPALGFFVILAIASGSWYYYNSHVRNEFLNAKQRREIQADYERDYKKYELLAAAENHRRRRKNRHLPRAPLLRWQRPIRLAKQNRQTHRSDPHHRSDAERRLDVKFDRAFHKVSSGPRDIYTIYALDKPLQPGETMHDDLQCGLRISRAFATATSAPSSPTTAHSSTAPISRPSATTATSNSTIPAVAREEKLPALEEMAARGDCLLGACQSLHSAIRLDHLPHRGQHFRRSDRHRSRLPPTRVDRKRPPLLRIRYGRDSHWPISSPTSPAATR